ncbi:MAG: hypothetical protein KAX18_02895, partial [Candidatus Lokiarchaeota archaeon]|nr:hypothetical protein [Candidatus Lokiarchaeota archaeon]
MVTETVEKKTITKEDIFIKARMISEGVSVDVTKDVSSELYKMSMSKDNAGSNGLEIPDKLDFNDPERIIELFAEVNKTDTSSDFRQTIIFDGSGLRAPIYINKRSRMELDIQNNKAIVSENGEILVTGTFPKRFEWLDEKLSNGLPISTVLPSMSTSIINVVFSLSCINYNSN